MTYIGVGYFC